MNEKISLKFEAEINQLFKLVNSVFAKNFSIKRGAEIEEKQKK